MEDYWTLIQKSLKGQLSDREKELLERWLDEDVENRKKFGEVKEIWKLTSPSGQPVL